MPAVGAIVRGALMLWHGTQHPPDGVIHHSDREFIPKAIAHLSAGGDSPQPSTDSS